MHQRHGPSVTDVRVKHAFTFPPWGQSKLFLDVRMGSPESGRRFNAFRVGKCRYTAAGPGFS